jgi:hypothetical protein
MAARKEACMRKGMFILVLFLGPFSSARAICNFETNPLDCIEVLDPHLGKQLVRGPNQNCAGDELGMFWWTPNFAGGTGNPAGGSMFDAAGDFYRIVGSYGNRDVVRVHPSGGQELVARGSCPQDNRGCPLGLSIDVTNGKVFLSVGSTCAEGSIIAITGLPTLFDIVQTYTPTADALQFRVPAHPEGLRSADHFDTYWGHVSDLPDFTQVQPMQCHYPATLPAVGDYLTVADTSPQPSPGAANYTVTAVTNGKQRRYGRKLIAGVMSGRDPAMLPGCP